MSNEQMMYEIQDLKAQRLEEQSEIKNLRIEQQKLEMLYNKFKEQQNDVFTTERLISPAEHMMENTYKHVYTKDQLASEISVVKQLLIAKIRKPKANNSLVGINSPSQKRRKKFMPSVCRACKVGITTK
jgi:hypothetical protein